MKCVVCGADACSCGGPAQLAYGPMMLEREQKIMAGWIADRRLYLDKDGNMVEADNPARVRLLIHTGQTMTEADARKYGLINNEPVAETAEKAMSPSPANKARVASTENKAPAGGQGDAAEQDQAGDVIFTPAPEFEQMLTEPEAPAVPRKAGKDK
jgi:hypothetical protein